MALLLCAFGYAQAQRGLKEWDIDPEKYPEISFVWNEYDPEVKDRSRFDVK